MNSELDSWEDDGLPDAAFTEDELAAGVQHIVRTGNPNATSSGRRPVFRAKLPFDWGDEDEEDALFSCSAATLRFETFAQAREWAKTNPGGVFTRASDGQGYEAKPARNEHSVNSMQSEINSYQNRTTEIKALVPHLHDVLSNSASNSRRLSIRPFQRGTWEAELNRLSTGQLKRLRMLVAVHLEDSRKQLRILYAEMRRFPSMKAGHYGEELSERLNEIMEGALADIDTYLTKGRDT